MHSRAIPDASMGNTEELFGNGVGAMMGWFRISWQNEEGPSAAEVGLICETCGTAKSLRETAGWGRASMIRSCLGLTPGGASPAPTGDLGN